MLTDIEVAKSIGAHGVVLGALTADRRIHVEHCQRLLEAANSLQTTFHRAFDVAVDPIEALEQIIELGFDRLLTSGQAATAAAGIPLLRQLCDRSQNRIIVLAGAGVNSDNAGQIVSATGVCELHASASVAGEGQSQGPVAFGTDRRVTSAELVQAIRRSLS
jgi:copper homeostasis protein